MSRWCAGGCPLADGANLTVFILAPDVALTLALAKEGAESNKSLSETVGPQSAAWREGFTGWTVAETFTLNRYRKRAA